MNGNVSLLLFENNANTNRPYLYSRYWTGTSVQLRLIQESFQMQVTFDLLTFPCMSLHCKLGIG